MSEKRFCKDCKHYRVALVSSYMAFPAACGHENNKSLVDGSPYHSPESLRYVPEQCGVEGRWWEAK